MESKPEPLKNGPWGLTEWFLAFAAVGLALLSCFLSVYRPVMVRDYEFRLWEVLPPLFALCCIGLTWRPATKTREYFPLLLATGILTLEFLWVSFILFIVLIFSGGHPTF
ncbi:MAG: hypothetical protein JKY65_09005 [Planctomycetes bacterium]|nr:hypothetical protein [Planctomycetota bacterium]